METRKTKLARQNARLISESATRAISTKVPSATKTSVSPLQNKKRKTKAPKDPVQHMNKSTTSPVKHNNESTKSPVKPKNEDTKAPKAPVNHVKSTKAPVNRTNKSTKPPKALKSKVLKDKKGNFGPKIDSALPFMRKHAKSLEDLAAIRKGSESEQAYGRVTADTTSPTPPPIALSSASASAGTATCRNNNEYLTTDGNDCRWIGMEESRRQEYCIDPKVAVNCPQICGKCCEDDAEFIFTFTKNCEWLRNPITPTESVERQCASADVQNACPIGCGLCAATDAGCEDDDTFVIKTVERNCSWFASASDDKRQTVCTRIEIKDACPVTCDICQDNVTNEPSQVPSFLPTDSLSSSPSNFPSVSPVMSPSASPSDVISEIPSVSPSITPTCHTPPKDPTNSTKTKCADDPYYETPFGGSCGCELFQGTNCNNWGALLNETQLDEIWNRCPVSCASPDCVK